MNKKRPITEAQKKAYDKYLEDHICAVVTCYALLTGQYLENHDASKRSDAEYEPYARFFYNEDGTRNEDPTELERREFNYAWLHHIHRNPHHWQFWVLVNDDDGTHALEMPERYITEMIADWGAFALLRKDPNDIIKFWEKKRDRYVFNPVTKRRVEQLVPIMATAIARHLGC